MNLKRRIVAVVVVVAMLFVTVHAGKMELSASSAEVETEEEDVQKETIYFWYTDETMMNYINNAAVTFGKEENVRIIPIFKETNKLLDEINTASLDVREKQLPDMYIIDNDSLEQAYLAGLASQVQDSEGILNEAFFPATALSAVTYHDRLVAYPFYYETSALLYNKDYLELWKTQQENRQPEEPEEVLPEDTTENPENLENLEITIPYEEMISPEGLPLSVDGVLYIANSFEAPQGVEGVLKWAVSDIFYNYWFVGNYLTVGGECGDDRSDINVNNEKIEDCLKVYQHLNQFFSIESDTVTPDSVVNDFIEGKVMFTIASTGILERLRQAKEEGTLNFEYGVANLPKVSTELESRSLSVTNAVVINGYSEHKDLANRFAAYLTNDFAEDLYARTGRVSANKRMNLSDELLQVFMKEYEQSISLSKVMEIGNLWLQLENLFAKVWNGEDITPLLEGLENQISTQIMDK